MADTYQTIRCPACGNIMKKIFIPSVGINVDICADGCGGIYFDNQELQLFEKGNDSAYSDIEKIYKGKVFSLVDQNLDRLCPSCASKMMKNNIKGSSVVIDTCYNCGAVFLDYGELELIRSMERRAPRRRVKAQDTFYENDTLRNFYREAQQEEKNFLLRRHSSYTIGDIIFDLISAMFNM